MTPLLTLMLVAALLWDDACTIRIQVDDLLQPLSAQDCAAELQPLLKHISYRQLFFPVLNGKYKLINHATGEPLRMETHRYADDLGNLYRGNESMSRNDDLFILKQMPSSGTDTLLPRYTMRKTGLDAFMATDGGNVELVYTSKAPADAHWRLELGEDGLHWSIQHVPTGKYLSAPSRSNVELGDTRNANSRWQLALPERSFIGGLVRGRQLRKQWEIVSEYPVMPGFSTSLKWKNACPEQKTCGASYANERDRHEFHGKIAETRRQVVTVNKVRGICDWTIASLREFVSDPHVVREIFEGVESCANPLLTDYAPAVARAIEAECYNDCMGEIKARIIHTEHCPIIEGTNWTQLFQELVWANQQCKELPADSLETLVDFVLQRYCLKWPAPSLLWLPHEEQPGDILQQDGLAACSVLKYEEKSKDARVIVQNGTCPEGTRCMCPETFAQPHRTVQDLRAVGFKTRRSTYYVTTGSAVVPSLKSQMAEDALTGISSLVLSGMLVGAVGGTALGVAATAAAAAPWAVGGFLVSTAYSIWMGVQARQRGWSCAESVGCWPEVPVRQKTRQSKKACRAPESAQSGGSPLWFLPPPTFQYKSTWSGCRLVTCPLEELVKEKVGFGRSKTDSVKAWKPNVYNCQPLMYKDMTLKQQSLMVHALQVSGASLEYALPDVL